MKLSQLVPQIRIEHSNKIAGKALARMYDTKTNTHIITLGLKDMHRLLTVNNYTWQVGSNGIWNRPIYLKEKLKSQLNRMVAIAS